MVDAIEEDNDNILADMLEDVAKMLRSKKDAVEWVDDTPEEYFMPEEVQEVLNRVSIDKLTGDK